MTIICFLHDYRYSTNQKTQTTKREGFKFTFELFLNRKWSKRLEMQRNFFVNSVYIHKYIQSTAESRAESMLP